jgi:hypothetical protein
MCSAICQLHICSSRLAGIAGGCVWDSWALLWQRGIYLVRNLRQVIILVGRWHVSGQTQQGALLLLLLRQGGQQLYECVWFSLGLCAVSCMLTLLLSRLVASAS